MAHIYFSTGDTYFGKHTLIYSSWITVDYSYVYIFAKITLISFNLCLQNGRKKEICLYSMHQELHTAKFKHTACLKDLAKFSKMLEQV